jgi:hypothetical protein
MVTEGKEIVEYVLSPDFLLQSFNWFDRGATDDDAGVDTKKSGLVGRLQNLKASVKNRD